MTTAACRTGAGATGTAAASCAQGANESRTVLTYGTNGNVTAMSRGAGDDSLVATTSFTYDAIGNLLTEDGPLAGSEDTVRHRYDAARRRVGTVGPDPDGSGALKHRAVRTTFRPDGQVSAVETGNVDSQSDAAWAAMSVAERVEIGFQGVRPVSSRFIAGGATEALTETSYDELGQVRCTAQRMHRDRFGITTDACTQSSQIASDPDRISRNVYDAVGRVTQVISGVGTELEAAEMTMTYTARDEIERLTDGEGNRTWFARDAHGRLVRTYFPLPVRGAQQESYTDYEEYTYDLAGNMLTRRLRDGQVIGMSYDQLNRLVAKDLPGNDPDVTYSYNLLGHMLSASQPGQALSFTYDALGRQRTQTSPRGTITSDYDIAGRRTRITHHDGFFVDQDYLVTGEMTRVRESGATSGVGVLATFAFDDRGRRTSLTRGNGTVTSYGYDAASRLRTLAENLGGTTYDQTATFGYSPAAQIATAERTNHEYSFVAAAGGGTDTHNGLNQVLTSGGTPVTHDARGNTTAIGSSTYAYDSLNRMVSAGTVAFGYDPADRLAYSTGDPQFTAFQYDGVSLVSERDYDGNVLRRYVHGPGIDEPLVWYEGSGTSSRRFLHADERGSIVARSDDSGNVTAVNRYDEYGVRAATNVGRFQYTGQMWMPEIGMYHFRARVYNPGAPAGGRFMQTDPIGYEDGPNMYQAFGSDPVNNVDPSGTSWHASRIGSHPDGRVILHGEAYFHKGTKDFITKTFYSKSVPSNESGIWESGFGGTDLMGASVYLASGSSPGPSQNGPSLGKSECAALVGGVVAGGASELGGLALHLARTGSVAAALAAGATVAGTLKMLAIAAAGGAVIYVSDRITGGAVSNAVGRVTGICR